MIKARVWKKIDENKIQCQLCNHFCILHDGERGKCGVRVNQNNELYTLVYEKVAALNIDPIEKKPLYHFLPGTKTFSLGTVGCNFSCTFCQNHALSQFPKKHNEIIGEKVTPEIIVQASINYNCDSISYTYSEPTIFFELLEDTAKIALDRNLKNVIVSNGFMSSHCLERLNGLIHGANIDLKSFSDDFYTKICDGKLKPVLNNLISLLKMGVWLEITTLLIPGKNDQEEELKNVAKFIKKELGENVPWHISRFHPDYKLFDSTITPLASLEKAYEIGLAEGLKYVYLGNVAGSTRENTYCHRCGALLIQRTGFHAEIMNLKNGHCKKCSTYIPGFWGNN